MPKQPKQPQTNLNEDLVILHTPELARCESLTAWIQRFSWYFPIEWVNVYIEKNATFSTYSTTWQ